MMIKYLSGNIFVPDYVNLHEWFCVKKIVQKKEK